MNSIYPDFSDAHADPSPQGARKHKDGVFCDISGTLVRYNSKSGSYEVDKAVLGYLRHRKRQGAAITLISKIPDNAEALGLGITQEFGDVIGKSYFQNLLLEELIDDFPDYLEAKKHINPKDSEHRKILIPYAYLGTDDYSPTAS